MIVFHASTVEIKKFYIPYGGLHLGGMMSAIDCALYKLRQGRRKDLTIDTIYIHKCTIEPGIVYLTTDHGSDRNWRKLGDKLFNEDIEYDIIQYQNEYEPDIVPSYCFFDTSRIKIIECIPMHMDVAEDYLKGIGIDEYRYSLS